MGVEVIHDDSSVWVRLKKLGDAAVCWVASIYCRLWGDFCQVATRYQGPPCVHLLTCRLLLQRGRSLQRWGFLLLIYLSEREARLGLRCVLYTADIYVRRTWSSSFFVSDSFRIPMEHPKIEAGSSTLPHTSVLSGVKGASILWWVIMARHRPNLATKDNTTTVIKYRHFHYIDSTLTSGYHPAWRPKVFVGVISELFFS